MDQFGLATWSATGVKELDPSSFTMRVAFSALVYFAPGTAGGTAQTFAVPGCNPQNSFSLVIPVDVYEGTIFEPQMLDGYVRVWRGHRTAVQGLNGYGTQRVLVVRFK